MLQRDGHPTALGEATINTYGRLFKSLHVLALIDDEELRRDIKGIRTTQPCALHCADPRLLPTSRSTVATDPE